MRKLTWTTIFIFVGLTHANAQDVRQNRFLIDMPTAGTLDRGSYDIRLRMYANGGLVGGVGVGITDRFMFGLSYGGENIIGAGDVNWNSNPGIQARFRMVDESYTLPAITVGFDSQGFGPFDKSTDRYANKSRGFFVTATKNYALFYNFGIHGGINRSFEDKDDDKDLNFFLGADLSFNREFRFLLEYDVAFNDNQNDTTFGSGDGYLNAGMQWSFSDRLILQFHLKDILKNGAGKVTREFKIGYFEYF